MERKKKGEGGRGMGEELSLESGERRMRGSNCNTYSGGEVGRW